LTIIIYIHYYVKMSFVVYNLAHRHASIVAKGPSVRIIGKFERIEMAQKYFSDGIETRMWDGSKVPKDTTVPCDIHWRPITDTNLSTVSEDESRETLQGEYDSIEQRLQDWYVWRESLSKETIEAAETHSLRSVESVRAETLLLQFLSEAKQDSKEDDPAYNVFMNTKRREAQRHNPTFSPTQIDMFLDNIWNQMNDVQKGPFRDYATRNPERSATTIVTSSPEIVGQKYMLIGIVGDAKYRRQKQQFLHELGALYFQELERFRTSETDTIFDLERQMYADNHQELIFTVLKPHVERISDAIHALSEEPMIAFFDVSEEPQDLITKSKEYARRSELKHVDLAVVRMSVWLRLDLGPMLNSVTHESRSTKGRDFFEILRQSSTV